MALQLAVGFRTHFSPRPSPSLKPWRGEETRRLPPGTSRKPVQCALGGGNLPKLGAEGGRAWHAVVRAHALEKCGGETRVVGPLCLPAISSSSIRCLLHDFIGVAGRAVLCSILLLNAVCGESLAVAVRPEFDAVTLSHQSAASSSMPAPLWEVAADASNSGKFAEIAVGESVVREAWQVVDENFLDARGKGFTREKWKARLNEVLAQPVTSSTAAYNQIRAMLRDLQDPYTRFLTPAEFSRLAKYDLTGVGLNLGDDVTAAGERVPRVLGLVIGSPAQQAGIQQNDDVLAVNDTSTSGMSAFEVSTLLQSLGGSEVQVKVRHSDGRVATVRMVGKTDLRSPVVVKVQQSADREGERVGYLKVKEFNALTQKEVLRGLELLKEQKVTSLVLDLQDNPGGLVQSGVEVARLFLDGDSTVLYQQGRADNPKASKKMVAQGPAKATEPIVVLVNSRTASASELVAAALQDNCRAVLVGGRTFGKGLIQSVYELSDGSGLVLTVGRYVTPALHYIEGKGLDPDFSRTPGERIGQARAYP
eukprot:jgi/Mesvir1/4096/Mv16058-RA.1